MYGMREFFGGDGNVLKFACGGRYMSPDTYKNSWNSTLKNERIFLKKVNFNVTYFSRTVKQQQKHNAKSTLRK